MKVSYGQRHAGIVRSCDSKLPFVHLFVDDKLSSSAISSHSSETGLARKLLMNNGSLSETKLRGMP